MAGVRSRITRCEGRAARAGSASEGGYRARRPWFGAPDCPGRSGRRANVSHRRRAAVQAPRASLRRAVACASSGSTDAASRGIATINYCLHEAGRAVAPVVEEQLLADVRAGGLLHVDETSNPSRGTAAGPDPRCVPRRALREAGFRAPRISSACRRHCTCGRFRSPVVPPPSRARHRLPDHPAAPGDRPRAGTRR
jgi:hypothetical protein